MQKQIEFEIPVEVDVRKADKIVKEVQMQKHTCIMKRLSFGEFNQLEEEATDIKSFAGQQPIVKISTSKMKELALLKSIVSSTYPLTTIAQIKELPREVGDLLFNSFTELNEQTPKKD
jgi:hypothetical protein